MNKNNKSTEEIMEKQRQEGRKNFYNRLIGLGWKKLGIALLVIVVAVVIYVVYIN